MQIRAVAGKQPSEMGTHGCMRRRTAILIALPHKLFASEVSMDFDPRSIDDSRERDVDGRELNRGSRGGLSNPRERERLDPAMCLRAISNYREAMDASACGHETAM